MKPSVPSTKRKKLQPIPTYGELAQLLVDLTEMNIANIDAPEYAFICCFTFSGSFADSWLTAIRYRNILRSQNQAQKGRKYEVIPKQKARKILEATR